MAKYKVKTMAVIDKNPVGSTIELPKETAEKLSALGYVNIIEEVNTKPKTPKKPAKSTSKKKTEDKSESTKAK